MPNEKIPYLCGGVFFSLLKQAVQPSVSSKEHSEGISDRHSDINLVKDFIIALSSDENIDDNIKEGKQKKSALKKSVSKYINCCENVPKKLPFAKQPFSLSYQWMIQNDYTKTIEKMQQFIQLHLDQKYYVWLVKAILNVIEKDVDIADTDQFFIDGNEIPKTKKEIKSINSFCLPAVLVGVMHYILLNRGKNNVDGAATLNKWGKQEQYIERTIGIDADLCIDREIEVFFEYPHHTEDLNAHEYEMTEALPEIKNRYSIQDEEMYECFKSDFQDTLVYIIENDPSTEPIDVSLRCDLADLSKKWNYLVYKFKDSSMRDDITKILDLIDQYSYYISDEFLRDLDEQKLIFRNQSIEEGNKLRDILQPHIADLREKIAVEFRQIYNI